MGQAQLGMVLFVGQFARRFPGTYLWQYLKRPTNPFAALETPAKPAPRHPTHNP
jgi:hypothetical protein